MPFLLTVYFNKGEFLDLILRTATCILLTELEESRSERQCVLNRALLSRKILIKYNLGILYLN